MDESILEDIKRMLGVDVTVDEFDIDIISAINSALFTMHQLGMCQDIIPTIDNETTWNELPTTAPKEVLREYIYLKVKLVFDPASSSFVSEALKDRISELEFRLNIHMDNGGGEIYG